MPGPPVPLWGDVAVPLNGLPGRPVPLCGPVAVPDSTAPDRADALALSAGVRSLLFVQAYPISKVAATQPAAINFFIGQLFRKEQALIYVCARDTQFTEKTWQHPCKIYSFFYQQKSGFQKVLILNLS